VQLVVAEAVLPGTPTPNHQAWEPFLLAQGYLFAWFDGANRFYLAEEHAELLRHFKLPANVWDRFERHAEIALRAQLQACQREIQAFKQEMSKN
jgi:hypothetical protein